jgi:Transposase DDE domain group 1
MTECIQTQFGFQAHGTRQVTAQFDGATMTSDAGGLLLREVDRKMNLLPRLAACFLDGRDPGRVQHSVTEMLSQRVSALALGYEDLNDHEQLRQDPVLKLLAGQADLEQLLAGKSTLNRLELGTGTNTRYKKITFWKQSIDELLVQVFVEAHTVAPPQIVLDIDTTDVALHGNQESRFFHGYYDHYCYLPLYIFAGEHLLCARLRPANIDGAAGSLDELQRIVAQLRTHWPETRILLRGDSGFCRDALLDWCENNRVDYVVGFARNPRLQTLIADALAQAQQQWDQTQKPARVFVEFPYRTVSGSWARERRVVAKAEHIEGKENPRFVVTSLAPADWPAQTLYEDLYCARGDMENRIKEQFMLFADRVSAESMRANQLRLYLSAMAYVLMCGLRRLGLQATELATAQAITIRLRLLKIGALIRVTVRRVWISLPRSYPWPELFERVHSALTT